MITREDIELYVMGQYDGDVDALERAIAADSTLGAQLADAARLELVLREAAAAAKFCPACDDLVRGERCDGCGAAVAPGGYTIERVLVSNAHGRMYVARDADGKHVALKELAFVHAPSPSAIAAFERETKFLRALEHAAIPRFVASFEEGTGVHARYYLAQELVEGTALDRLDEHWYSEAEIVEIARQVLAILVYLQGLTPMVIHRDIKPANLIKRGDGTIALVDFGAAHVQGATAGSTTIGTFGYMPIEQLAGIVDATSDVYALGMTLLHLMTRQEPWRLVQSRVEVNASPALRAWLDKAVAQDPRARFASAKDALVALDRREVPRVRRPRRRGFAIAAAAATSVTLGSIAAILTSHHKANHSTIATLRMEMTPGISAKLEVDGQIIGTVSDRQEIPVAAGRHQVVVHGPGSPCIDTIAAEGGKTITLGCVFAMPDATLDAGIARPPEAAGADAKLVYDIHLDTPLPRVSIAERVNWSYDHAKLHDVIRVFAHSCGVNVIVPDSVDGLVTTVLEGVRCDRAIEAVLDAHLLDYVYDPTANLMRIAPRKQLDENSPPEGDPLPSGGTLDIDFKDVPIVAMLRMLVQNADKPPVSLVLPDHIEGKVTAFGKHMPWQQAFQNVLASHGLWYHYDARSRVIKIVRDTQ